MQSEIAATVEEYRSTANSSLLRSRLERVAAGATPDALVAAAEPFREIPEVAATLYERIVDAQPNNARALVIFANACWLLNRGSDLVGELATRAMAADPANRGAWHLWALSESDPRQRTARWMQITERFPTDLLALAALADNAASLAGAEHDYEALDLAVASYERLLATAETAEQRTALETALRSLKGWRF